MVVSKFFNAPPRPNPSIPRPRHGYVAQMDASHLKGMQHRLAHTRTHKLHQTDAGGDNSDPAEGEE